MVSPLKICENKLNYDYIKQVAEVPRLIIWNLKLKKSSRRPKRVLIINTCLIGDIAASIPSLEQFIKRKPYAKVDIIVPPPMKSVIERVRGVNKVYTAKSVSNREIDGISMSDSETEEIRKTEYDLVMIIRLSRDAHNLLKQLNPRSIKVSASSYLSYILHLLKYIILKGNVKHLGKVKQYYEVNFEWIGEKNRKQKISFNRLFHFSKEDYEKIKKMEIMQGTEKKMIIHAGAGWRKQWETKKWIELLKRINNLGNFKFIFVGGEKVEEEIFKSIQKNLDFKAYSLIKKTDLKDLMLVMRLSNYFIGIDSGPRNLAHLVGLRSLILLGPGPKHFMPYSKKDIAVDKSHCKCTQLFCFKKETCMQQITVDDAFEGFKKMTRVKNETNKIGL